MESETPDTGTEPGTIGSLELNHEEAKELCRSIDLSLAFWGNARDQVNMIPATKLKCSPEKSSGTSETAIMLWERMGQKELEKIRQVEKVLMKEGEICADNLFSVLKSIMEGVGMSIDSLISTLDTGSVTSFLVNIMTEILYIFNQNEPPEIVDDDEFIQGYGEGELGTPVDYEDMAEICQDEMNEITNKINLLLKKAKDLNLGDIKVPSTPKLSARSKLSIIEKQVKAKLRLKNIRRVIQMRRRMMMHEAGEKEEVSRISKERNKNTIKSTSNKPKTEDLSTRHRPAFKTAVKSQSLEYDSKIQNVPNLQNRLKKANQIRKRLFEGTNKPDRAHFQNKIGRNFQNNEESTNKLQKTCNLSVNKAKNCRKKGVLGTINDNKVQTKNRKTLQTMDLWNNVEEDACDFSEGIRKEYDFLYDDGLKADEELEFPKPSSQGHAGTYSNTYGHKGNLQFSSFYSTDIITSIQNSVEEEYELINECNEELDEEKHFNSWMDSHEQERNAVTNETEERLSDGIKDFVMGNNIVELETDDYRESLVENEGKSRDVGEANEKTKQETLFGDRPCSRDEMLVEMKKLLKEALSEVANPCQLRHCGHNNSFEFTGNEGPVLMDSKDLVSARNATSLESQTSNPLLETVPDQTEDYAFHDKINEETKVDIERTVNSNEDIVDIKVTQESELMSKWSFTNEGDRKMSTEISVSKIGSGSGVKVSVVSQLKGQDLSNEKNTDFRNEGNVQNAINVLKDFLKVTVPEENVPLDINSNASLVHSKKPGENMTLPDANIEVTNGVDPTIESESNFSQDSGFPLHPQDYPKHHSSVENMEFTPINVNLAMLLQEVSHIPPREDFRSCAPFQVGGLLVSETLAHPRITEDIGDGNELYYPDPYRDFWSAHMVHETFVASPLLNESDSLFVNRSDGSIQEEATEINRIPQETPTHLSDLEVVESEEVSLPKRMFHRVRNAVGTFFEILTSPLYFSVKLMKSSFDKISFRRTASAICDNCPVSDGTPPT